MRRCSLAQCLVAHYLMGRAVASRGISGKRGEMGGTRKEHLSLKLAAIRLGSSQSALRFLIFILCNFSSGPTSTYVDLLLFDIMAKYCIANIFFSLLRLLASSTSLAPLFLGSFWFFFLYIPF